MISLAVLSLAQNLTEVKRLHQQPVSYCGLFVPQTDVMSSSKNELETVNALPTPHFLFP